MNPYKLLGLKSNATDAQIRGAWRAKARQWHPDRCASPWANRVSAAVNEAAETLLDPAKRKVVNLQLALEALRSSRPRPVAAPAAPATTEGPMMKIVSQHARNLDPLAQIGFVLLAAILDRELAKTP